MAAAAVAIFVFGVAGFTASVAIGIHPPSRQWFVGRLLAVPAIGLSMYGPFAFLTVSLLGFSPATVVGSWVAFNVAAGFWGWKRPMLNAGDAVPLSPSISNRSAAGLILLCVAWGLIPTIQIYPFVRGHGIYTSDPLADHVKVALTDAIVRDGMPLKNPFYALAAGHGAAAGQRIKLTYSYGWYVPAAITKLCCHSSGWQAEVAMTWVTSVATCGFLAAIACGYFGGAAAGFWTVVVLAVGPLSSDLLPMIFGPRAGPIVGLLATHGLEVPWIQLAWAPQHAFAALAVVVTVWLVAATINASQFRPRFVIAIALSAAAAFESSSWVGGVALMAAMPAFLIAAFALRLPWKQYTGFAKSIGAAVLLAGIVILPLLLAFRSGSVQSEQPRSIGFGIFASTQLEEHLGLSGNAFLIARIILFWVHFLPLSFGAIYVIGFPAMLALRGRTTGERTFRALAIAGTVGFLLVSQFIKSTIRANDLGWRAVNVSLMLLAIFAGIAIADLVRTTSVTVVQWNWRRWLPGRRVLVPTALCILTLGLLSTARVEGLPTPPAAVPISPEDARLHEAFARQMEAWTRVRRYTRPHDLVQANPDAFSDLPPWAISLPFHLFADRSAAYACDGTSRTYAFMYSWDDNRRQGRLVASVFSATPHVAAIKHLRWDLNVMAILVTAADPVWKSHAIEDSGVYKIKAQTADYRIYVPTVKTLRAK